MPAGPFALVVVAYQQLLRLSQVWQVQPMQGYPIHRDRVLNDSRVHLKQSLPKGQSSGELQSAGHSLCFGCFGNHHADPEASDIDCQLISEAFAGMVLKILTPALATQVSTHATQIITQRKVLA
jgi:hypothetical protein